MILGAPVEIFKLVADQLDERDLYECTIVCKLWHSHFQAILWRKVVLSAPVDLHIIINGYHNFPISLYRNGGFIRELHLEKDAYANSRQLKILQHFVRDLRHLVISEHGPCFGSIKSAISWELWRKLVTLNIISGQSRLNDQISKDHMLEGFQDNMSRLSRIRCSLPKTDPWRLADLETLHSCLPSLKQLSIDLAIDISIEDLSTTKYVLPAYNIESLHVATFVDHPLWTYYIPRKYPNLQELVFDKVTAMVKDPRSIKHHSRIPIETPSQLPFLKKVKVSYEANCECDPVLFSKSVLSSTSIRELSYTLSFYGYFVDNIVQAFGKSLSCFPKTVEKLFISTFVNLAIPPNFSLGIRAFPRLVELHIEIPEIDIGIDSLLRDCKSLNKLRLKSVVLNPLVDKYSKSQPHGLQYVELENTTFHCNMLNYLSCRCKDLASMILVDCRIEGTVDRNDGFMQISMYETSFKVLSFTRVYFKAVDSEWKTNSAINLIFFEWLDNNLIDQSTFSQSSDIDCDITIYVPTTWYHIHYFCPRHKAGIGYENLDSSAAEEVKEYMKAFGSKDVDGFGVSDNVVRNYFGHTSQGSWKSDLPGGFVVFSCRKVEKQILDNSEYLQ
ncbi:hypothetical protein CLU79DRAFT_781848 [Phycomyces nitens]|nr:hypothetical protein CLU79DRAFT_781848 [Phycomyces nitens]